MNEIEAHYNKFNEEKRLDSRHGRVEYITSMKYIHKYIPECDNPADINILDIGAGTGSVSVEAALAAYEGKVYAVERDERGIELIRRNAVKFHTDNIMCVCGEAPEALHDLPAPDVCFIGGAGGRLGQITDAVSRMMKDSVRIVITAVTLQTLTQASELLEKAGAEDISVSQIQVSETYKAGKYDIFKAQNPVFIIEAVLKRQK